MRPVTQQDSYYRILPALLAGDLIRRNLDLDTSDARVNRAIVVPVVLIFNSFANTSAIA